jgi:PAS domain S-box-containing protein
MTQALYVSALAWNAAALALALVLRPSVDPATLFVAAVAAATWTGGWRAGLFAAGLATITVDYFFIAPVHSFMVTGDQAPRLAVFAGCALAVSWASTVHPQRDEPHLHALFDEAPMGIALVNASGHAFKVNRRLCELFGYSEREFRGFSITRITHPACGESDWNLFAELAHGAKASYRMEKCCWTKDGQPVQAHLNVSLVRDDQGAPLFGIVVVLTV